MNGIYESATLTKNVLGIEPVMNEYMSVPS